MKYWRFLIDSRKKITLGVWLVFLVACEPFAPDTEQQVIIVTSETQVATEVVNLIPASSTPLPTPTLVPTMVIIPTATVPPCSRTEGQILNLKLTSQIAAEPIPYNVYLPPCFFESGRRYPLLMLLHGSGYAYEQWLDLGIQIALDEGIAAQTLTPMVVVMPEGGVYQENNVFELARSYEDILLNELIPNLNETFCLQSKAALGGISRGGFWAYSIGLRHPDQFVAIGGHSPWFVPDNAPATHNPLALAERAQAIEGLRLYLDHAQSDQGGANVIAFSNSLRTRGIIHTYVINPVGDHNNDYWSAHLNEYLTFYSQAFPPSLEEFPSCQ